MHNKIMINSYKVGEYTYTSEIIPKIEYGEVGDTILRYKRKWEKIPRNTRQTLNKFVLALTKHFPETFNAKADFTLYE